MSEQKQTVSESDMTFYYTHFLPFDLVYQWLNHASKTPTKSFTFREFAYEYRSGAYQRYNSFGSAEELKKSVLKANPTRFEVGAVYNVNPKERKILPKSALKPVEKDLVFDIDLTDYDGIRTCCSGTSICGKCWKFITVASKVLETSLREDFGFNNMVWVFSGRRGAHCWVSDKQARELPENVRRAIVEYMDVLGGNTRNKNKVGLQLHRPLHPHLQRSLNVLKQSFKEIILDDQDPWRNDKVAQEQLLAMIPDRALNAALKKYWDEKPGRSSFDKWSDIKSVFEKTSSDNKVSVAQFQNMREDIIFEMLYPRLDIEVSRQLIHLLKSPFCIHPGTGNVCVPFNAAEMYQGYISKSGKGFDPMNAPNLANLQSQYLKDGTTHELDPYIAIFKQFIQGLAQEEEEQVQEQEQLQGANENKRVKVN